jgi:hypothetical protein
MADERSKVLAQVAEHFDERVAELDEIARHYGHQDIGAPLLRAQAMALREAAVYARTLAANGIQATKAAKPTTRRRGRPPKSPKSEAPITSIPAPEPNPKPWEGAST